MRRLLNAESEVERVQAPTRRSGTHAGEADGHTRVVLSGRTTFVQPPQNWLERKRCGTVLPSGPSSSRAMLIMSQLRTENSRMSTHTAARLFRAQRRRRRGQRCAFGLVGERARPPMAPIVSPRPAPANGSRRWRRSLARSRRSASGATHPAQRGQPLQETRGRQQQSIA
jgi:hypothetical protein